MVRRYFICNKRDAALASTEVFKVKGALVYHISRAWLCGFSISLVKMFFTSPVAYSIGLFLIFTPVLGREAIYCSISGRRVFSS